VITVLPVKRPAWWERYIWLYELLLLSLTYTVRRLVMTVKGKKKRKSVVKTKPMAKMPTVELPKGGNIPSGINPSVLGI
jgi:hypothetical protein